MTMQNSIILDLDSDAVNSVRLSEIVCCHSVNRYTASTFIVTGSILHTKGYLAFMFLEDALSNPDSFLQVIFKARLGMDLF